MERVWERKEKMLTKTYTNARVCVCVHSLEVTRKNRKENKRI